MSGRWLFVVNPAAGNGAGEATWKVLEKALNESGLPHVAAFPKTIDAASLLIHLRAVESICGVIAVGGDGTVHGVVNGVMRVAHAGGGQIPVGIIPTGQLNDFARNFSIPVDKPLAALRRMTTNASIHPVDVGTLSSPSLQHPLYFANGVLIGLQPRFAELRGEGRQLTLLSTLSYWRHYAPRTLTVTYGDVTRTQPLSLLAYTNGARHLGGLRFAPDAAPDDGALELTLIRAVTRLTAANLMVRADRGELLPHVAVTQERTDHVLLRSDEPIPLLLDGESLNLPLHEITLGIERGALSLLY